jgi:hypothetical protein
MTLKRLLDKVIDPRGPIGEWLSPSITFKPRAGLPIAAPFSARAEMGTSAEVERALAAPRFVRADEADAPANRVRQVSAFVAERWAPVYAKTESMDLVEILRASETLIGWQVTQHVHSAHCDCTHARFEIESDGRMVHHACGRARKPISAEAFNEIVKSMQVQSTDDFYNGVYETIPGNDPIVLEGELLCGQPTYDSEGRMTHDGIIRGTMIKGGRREYRERTKGFVHWDKGFLEQRKIALAEEASRPVRNVQRALDATKGRVLPMRRIVGINPRYDRKSAV